jgi:hypothetical protein
MLRQIWIWVSWVKILGQTAQIWEILVNALGATVFVQISWILVRKVALMIFRSSLNTSIGQLGWKLGHTAPIMKNDFNTLVDIVPVQISWKFGLSLHNDVSEIRDIMALLIVNCYLRLHHNFTFNGFECDHKNKFITFYNNKSQMDNM